MEPGARAEFLRFLEQQRADYLLALAPKLDEVERLWRGIAKGTAAPGDLALVVRAAHGLAGSGAVFGFTELGAAAKSLELQLQALAGSPQPPCDAADGIEKSVARLRTCAPPAG